MFYHLDEVIKEGLDSESKEARPAIPRFAWQITHSKATQAVRDVLDGDVFELLARAWCVARELHEFTDRGKYPPGKASTVFLGNHQVSTEVHPVLVVTVGSIEGPCLRFTLTLTARFAPRRCRSVMGTSRRSMQATARSARSSSTKT